MKFWKLILVLILTNLSFISTSWAYNVYNKTRYALTVKDIAKGSGIEESVASNSKISCNPTARGCSGYIYFTVRTTSPGRKILCEWSGKLSNGTGHYFVIVEDASIPFPFYGSCHIEFYRD